MITVSSGVFMGVDFADAAVRAIHSKSAVMFFLRISYVGVATFVVACVVDARGVLADKAATEGESPEKAYECELSDLGCFTLDFQRARVMHSLMRRSVVYDIEHEKHDKRKAKKGVWLEEWSGKMAETVGLAWAANAGYFLEGDELYRVIERLSAESLDDSWLWLVALETRRFKAYEPLHGDNDKDYKGLKLASDYLKDVFCERCGVLDAKELDKLAKAVKAMQDSLDRKMPKVAIGAVGVAVLAVTTGGFAFYFAPALAPTLAAALGASTASLSGAALTSASLAFLGGGALSAGGAGMAGKTMLIAGGGALIGAVGGSGVSAATAMALASGESRVLEECAKLVTFCEEVLLVRCGDYAAVTEIHASLNRRVVEMEAEVESVRRSIKETVSRTKGEKPKKNEMTPKQMLKVLERSCEYLRRVDKRLVKALAKAGVGQRQLAASGV